MAIEVDVQLVSTVQQRPDVSAIVDLEGALGSSFVSGSLEVEDEIVASATGAYLALSSDVSFDAGVSGLGKRLIIPKETTITSDTTGAVGAYYTYFWDLDYAGYNVYEPNVLRPTVMVVEDYYGFSQDVMTMSPSVSLSVSPVAPLIIPARPAAPLPLDENDEYPMPVAGGMVVRAIPGIAVQVDTPVIVDGKPT